MRGRRLDVVAARDGDDAEKQEEERVSESVPSGRVGSGRIDPARADAEKSDDQYRASRAPEQIDAREQRQRVAGRDRRLQPGEREHAVLQSPDQFRVLAVLGLLNEILVVVGEYAAELDQPSGQECKEQRRRGEDVIVERQARRHGRRSRRGRQRVSRIEQLAKPEFAP